MRFLLFFITFTSYFVKFAVQSSSHNFSTEMKVPLFKLLKLYAILAFLVNSFGNGNSAFLVGIMTLLLATVIYGPIVFSASLKIGS